MAKGQHCHRWCVKIVFLFFVISVSNSTLEKEKPLAIDSWGVTGLKTITLNYLWTIENFSWYNKAEGESIDSPIFSSSENNKFEWSVLIIPKGNKIFHKDEVGIYLKYNNGPSPLVQTNVVVSLLNTARDKDKTATANYAMKKGSNNGWYDFIKRDALLNEANGFLVNDVLNIHVKVQFQTEVVSSSGMCGIRNEKELENQYSDHLLPLLLSGNFSDVYLTLRGQHIPVHKGILAARSPVFADLFVHNGNHPVELKIDVHRDIISEALHYIYTGRVRNIEKIADQLLKVAVFYEIDDLRMLCEESLCRNLGLDNAVAVIRVAERYNAYKLRSKAIEFVAIHATELINTDEFKALEHSRPDVIIELFHAMVKSGKEYSTLLSGVFHGLSLSVEKAPVSNSTSKTFVT